MSIENVKNTDKNESSKNNGKSKEKKSDAVTAKDGMPEGYRKRGMDLVGFWEPELGRIHCIARAQKLFDGNINAEKPATLLICQLVEPCNSITVKDGEEVELVNAEVGELVSIWFKPGMAGIRMLCGEPCIIQYERDASGEIVTKKMKKNGMNPMKMFEVLSKKNPGKLIPVIEDSRVESAHVATLLVGAKKVSPVQEMAQKSESTNDVDYGHGDEDIPF